MTKFKKHVQKIHTWDKQGNLNLKGIIKTFKLIR